MSITRQRTSSRVRQLGLAALLAVSLSSLAQAGEAGLNVVFALAVNNTLTVSGPWAPDLPDGAVTPGTSLVVADSSTYLQYSSKDKQHDTVRVQLSRALPTWLTLQVQAVPPAGCGTSAGWVTPTSYTSRVVISSIPTYAVTGSPGAVLNYRLTISDWSAARAGALSALGAVYTLVSN